MKKIFAVFLALLAAAVPLSAKELGPMSRPPEALSEWSNQTENGFTLVGVSPREIVVGTSVEVYFTGTGFQPTTTFQFGSETRVTNLQVSGPTTASATLTVTERARLGDRTVIAVQFPGGPEAALENAITIFEYPVWNYMVSPNFTAPTVYQCVRDRYVEDVDPKTHKIGWAPDEGAFYHELTPGFITGPKGLALDILECYIPLWNTEQGGLFQGYCWEQPTPTYIGDYPFQRYAHFRIFFAINFVCSEPPPGTTVFESTLSIERSLYYPPPLFGGGFED